MKVLTIAIILILAFVSGICALEWEDMGANLSIVAGSDSEEPVWIGVGNRPHGGQDETTFHSTTAGEAVYECMCGSENDDCDWYFRIEVDGIQVVSEGDHNCGCLDLVAGIFNIHSIDQPIHMEIQIDCDEVCGVWGRVFMPPLAEFQAVPVSGPVPLVVQFENLSQGYYASLEWHFGDGTMSSSENPTHTYDSAGDYTVTLIARGRNVSQWLDAPSSTETKQDYIHVTDGMIGDVNNDGIITASDAQLCFQIVLSLYSPTPGEEYRADANEDGQVTAGDAQIIFQLSLQ
ncbi:PKD domain-containing protein [bacterium]|nr:PKD domain-containing protein [candidate division CSSED10-310 bacterium]